MKLNELIEEGDKLYNEALLRRGNSTLWGFEGIFLFKYRAWLESVHAYLKSQGLFSKLFAAHLPSSLMTGSQTLSINGELGLIHGGTSPLEKFLDDITEQLEFLGGIKRPKVSKQTEIVIDVTRGISRKGENETIFWIRAVRPKSKIFKVVRVLSNSEGSVSIEKIAKETKWEGKLVTRGIKGLNANAKKNLQITHNLVLSVPSSYELNRNNFNFRIEGEE